MLKPEVTARAMKDLEDILIYSHQNWGEKKADSYVGNILTKINNDLMNNQELGSSCHDIRYDYKKIAVDLHVIFYKIRAKRIYIVRVLHNKRDYKKALLN